MKKTPISIMTHLEHCEDLLKCIWNLTTVEVQVYRLLLMEGPLTATEVGEKIGRSPN